MQIERKKQSTVYKKNVVCLLKSIERLLKKYWTFTEKVLDVYRKSIECLLKKHRAARHRPSIFNFLHLSHLSHI